MDKSMPEDENDRMLRIGQSICLTCSECMREFEVVLEPKYSGTKDAGSGLAVQVGWCPFCGATGELEE